MKTKMRLRFFFAFVCSAMCSAMCSAQANKAYFLPKSVDAEKGRDFWLAKSFDELNEVIFGAKPLLKEAKNVILFVGDGMGISTVTAARILAGQKLGKNGEEHLLSFETFPHVGLSKTYNVDHQVADSASTATAYLCGVKTNSYTVGVNAHATVDNCSLLTDDMKVTSILDWSMTAGKSTGLVTTTSVTHATPAASYAHSANRGWEGEVPSSQGTSRNCKDIAHQLVIDNPDINVVMGGGFHYFLPTNYLDPETGLITSGRSDNQNLVLQWAKHQDSLQREWESVSTLAEFSAVNTEVTDYLFGLFSPEHMEYEQERLSDPGGSPSLAQMTEKAIQILSKKPEGFFLLVEGGLIDIAHHGGQANIALHETVAFSDAVAKAVDLTDAKDTLIIVTADHSHTMTIAGYAGRGNDITGLSENEHGLSLGSDYMPYTTLLYATGPGAQDGLRTSVPGRRNPSKANFSNPNYRQQAIVPMPTETHGGEDVAIYARGPMSHLFHGVHEQSYIAHVMAYASCVGDYSDNCARKPGRLYP